MRLRTYSFRILGKEVGKEIGQAPGFVLFIEAPVKRGAYSIEPQQAAPPRRPHSRRNLSQGQHGQAGHQQSAPRTRGGSAQLRRRLLTAYCKGQN
jgi:hypothetical protein